MALIENIQREDLNPLEEAEALKRLISRIRADPPAGRRRRRPLARRGQQPAAAPGSAPAKSQDLVRQGALEMGHARALLALKGTGPDGRRRRVVDRGLSVRETEKLVRQPPQGDAGEARVTPGKPKTDPDVGRLEAH